jgi:hypothetical protein
VVFFTRLDPARRVPLPVEDLVKLEGPGPHAGLETLLACSPTELARFAPRLLELLKAPSFGRDEVSARTRATVVTAVLRAGYPFALSLDPEELVLVRAEVKRERSRRLARLALAAMVVLLAAGSIALGARGTSIASFDDDAGAPVWETSPSEAPRLRSTSDPDSFANLTVVDAELASASTDSAITHAARMALAVDQTAAPLWALAAAWEDRHRVTQDPKYLRLRDDAIAATASKTNRMRLSTQLAALDPKPSPERAPQLHLRNAATLHLQAVLASENGDFAGAAELAWVCARDFPPAASCLALHIEARQRLRDQRWSASHREYWPSMGEARDDLARRLATERLRPASASGD